MKRELRRALLGAVVGLVGLLGAAAPVGAHDPNVHCDYGVHIPGDDSLHMPCTTE